MNQGETLKEAVRRDPSDVESRLVYGDWLLETGDPHGEFVVQHCKLETMSGLEETYAELLANTARLEAAHVRAWLGEYAERLASEQLVLETFSRLNVSEHFNPVFRHGFLYRIAARATDIAKQWPWLREREPLAGMEILVHEGVSDVRQPPPVSEWRTLKISPNDWFTAHSLADVLRWGFPVLRELDVSGCDIGEIGCRVLTGDETDFDGKEAPPKFSNGQLESLILRNSGIRDAGAALLFDSPIVGGLVELDISQCRLTEVQTLEHLRRSETLTNLRRLSIAGNNELGSRLGALAGWPTLTKLERLALPQSTTADDIASLFPEPSAVLRELDLAAAKGLLSTPEAVAAIAKSLAEINLGSTRLGDASFAKLIEAPSLRRVHALRAGGCSLSDKGVLALLDSELDAVVTLDLSSNKLTDKSLTELAAWPRLRNVTRLRLGNNRKLSPAGYAALCEADQFAPVSLDVGKLKGDVAPLRERFGAALTVSV